MWGPELQAPDRPADPDAADAAPVRVDEPAARAGAARPRRRRHPIVRHQDRDALLPPARRRLRHRLLRPRAAAHRRAGARARGRSATRTAQGASPRSTSRTPGTSTRTLVPAVHEAGHRGVVQRALRLHDRRQPAAGAELATSTACCWPRRCGSRTPPAARARWPTCAAGPRPGPGARSGAPRPLPAAPRGAGLRAGARLPAVRRGIRRPAPGAAAGAPARAAHGALPPALRGARRAS